MGVKVWSGRGKGWWGQGLGRSRGSGASRVVGVKGW